MAKFVVNIDSIEMKQQLERDVWKIAYDTAQHQLRKYFQEAGTYKGATAGLGCETIKKAIEDMLSSPEFQKQIDKRIKQEFEQAFEVALKKACENSAKKLAFTKVDTFINNNMSE